MAKKPVLVMLAAVLVLAAACVSHAQIISEDVSYWYKTDTGGMATVFNPNSGWINEHLSSLVIKVQQTVYNQDMTAAILQANGDEVVPGGYLYAYSVTNLAWIDTMTSGGLQAFGVEWGVAPDLVTIDRSKTIAFWTPIAAGTQDGYPVNGAAWVWNSDQLPGLLPGGTQGGFWAVSRVGQDTVVNAVGANSLGTPGQQLIWGQTTGPVPEPSGAVAFATGLAGLTGLFLRKRR